MDITMDTETLKRDANRILNHTGLVGANCLGSTIIRLEYRMRVFTSLHEEMMNYLQSDPEPYLAWKTIVIGYAAQLESRLREYRSRGWFGRWLVVWKVIAEER